MQNYDKSAEYGMNLIFKAFKERMKELKITQKELSEKININESSLIRNFKGETVMSLPTFLKMCGALEIMPYFIGKEDNPFEIKKIKDFETGEEYDLEKEKEKVLAIKVGINDEAAANNKGYIGWAYVENEKNLEDR